jgi:hypothetical protein
MSNFTPKFLQKKMEFDDRYNAEMSYATYLRSTNKTARLGAREDFKFAWIHPYLCRFDKRWTSIPITQMKTTAPRSLVASLNNHINKWRKDIESVQKRMNVISPDNDISAEADANQDRDPTVSDQSCDDNEESKEAAPY